MSSARKSGPPDLASLDGGALPRWLTDEAIETVGAMESLPFEPEEYLARMHSVRAAMAEARVDAVIVFRPSSVEYLCGYHTAETTPQPLLVTESDAILLVPDFEVGRALASSCVPKVRFFRYAGAHRAPASIAGLIAATMPRAGRVAVELEQAGTPPSLVELLRSDGLDVVDGACLVEMVRLVLSPAEIGCVEGAAVHTQRGVDAAVRAASEAGATDSSVASAISAALTGEANSASAWVTAVATGPRAGVPHASWKGFPLSSEATFVEFSGTQHRYHAPVMRTLCRQPPSARVRQLAGFARTALAAVLESAKPGVPCADVARHAMTALDPLPDDVVFHELFGYPVGLAHPPHWMDGAPFAITADNPEPLRAGMVFHMPGSFRAFGQCGVGLSQTFVVEDSGTRVLTHGTADLIEL